MDLKLVNIDEEIIFDKVNKNIDLSPHISLFASQEAKQRQIIGCIVLSVEIR